MKPFEPELYVIEMTFYNKKIIYKQMKKCELMLIASGMLQNLLE